MDPVEKLASSDASHKIARATSSDVPTRFIGSVRAELGHPVRLAAGGMDVGVDRAGPDRGHADALVHDLPRKSDGEGVDRALRGGIVDTSPRRRRAWPRPTTR